MLQSSCADPWQIIEIDPFEIPRSLLHEKIPRYLGALTGGVEISQDNTDFTTFGGPRQPAAPPSALITACCRKQTLLRRISSGVGLILVGKPVRFSSTRHEHCKDLR